MDIALLVQRAQAGDDGAYTTLIAAHTEALYRLCYRMTGNAEAAEELAHEACIEAFVKLNQLREPERFYPWLHTIAYNLYRMALRRRQLEQTELLDNLPYTEAAGPDPVISRLARGLTHLSYPQRLALALHYLEGLSYEEMALFLDVPVGTVMSRLHRGRKELKQQTERLTDEEIPMLPEESFTEDVRAEIALLLELLRRDDMAMERLSVLLARSPERISQLIADAQSEETLQHIARLLRHLGREAIEVVLQSAFSDDAAMRVLQLFIAGIRQDERGGPALAKMSPMPVYLLVDGLLRSTVPEEQKADVLAALLDVSTDEPTTLLLTTTLLGFPDAALPRLLARFWENPTNVTVLSALARMGTHFVAELLPALSSADRQLTALQGMEAFARSYYSRHGAADACSVRSGAKWAPIPAEHVDEAVVASALQRVAACLVDEQTDIREQALRVLGLLRATVYMDQVAALTQHTQRSTRVAALRALADMGDDAAIPVFVRAAEAGTTQERLVAVEALGRMQATSALPVVQARLDDAEAQVRRAAILALGDIGGETARELLQQRMRDADKTIARTAATTLHTSPHFRYRRQVDPAQQAMREEVRTRLVGEVQPGQFISLSAAIAALPEIRPYREQEVTRFIAQACIDYSTTRRQLIMDRFMEREHGVYTLTEAGKAVWRVERFIAAHYLRGMHEDRAGL